MYNQYTEDAAPSSLLFGCEHDELDGLIDLGLAGIGGLVTLQRKALQEAGVTIEELMDE